MIALHRIPNHCKITPHSWHSRLVTEDKVALYLHQTILLCKHTVCILIQTSILPGYLHVQNSVWLLCSNPFLTLLSSHIMQTTAPQKRLVIAVRQRNPPLFTLIPRRLGVIFHAFSVLVALADKAGSFMVDLKEMRATNLLCLVATQRECANV